MCYYFNETIAIEDFDPDNILIDEKSLKNILVHNNFQECLIAFTTLPTRFDKIDRFIRVYNGNRYLVLLASEKYDFIYNRIRYLLAVKIGITYIVSHNYATLYFQKKQQLFIMF